jgi:hypothetical protein
MSLRSLAAIAAALLVATASAHADPITDFMIGTTVYLRNGSATIDDLTHTTGGVALTKPANTLSFNLSASALGVPLPIVAHLTGTQLGTNLVQFTFDESYGGSGLLLVDGVHLTHATGTITAAVSYVPGTTGPLCNGAACLGDVLLDVLPPMSSIHVQGDFGDTFIAINYAQLIGGVAVPRLKSFYYAGDPVCSKPTPTTAYLSVRLAGPSPSPGTQVVLHSAFPAGVSVPLLQSVLAGHDSTTVTATIAPSFFGIVHIAAAAGGAMGFVDLEVDHEHDCDPPKHRRQWRDYNPDPGCIQCTVFVTHNNDDDRLMREARQTKLVMGGTVTVDPLTIVPGASAVSVVGIANNGMVTGSMTVGGVTQAYRANLKGGPGAVQALGAFTVRGINQFGTVIGTRTAAGHAVAVYEAGRGMIDIPVCGAATTTATSINDSGAALGFYTNAAGAVRGFRYAGGSNATDLPLIGSAPILPIAENDAGQILGTATASGVVTSVVVSPAGSVARLAPPAGYTTFVARSINRAGRVVGTATTSAGLARAVVWNPTTGFIPLTDYIPGMVATDALHITDGDDVVVQGTLNGRTDLFLVSL